MSLLKKYWWNNKDRYERENWETDKIIAVMKALVGAETREEIISVQKRIESSSKFTDDFERQTAQRLATFRLQELSFSDALNRR